MRARAEMRTLPPDTSLAFYSLQRTEPVTHQRHKTTRSLLLALATATLTMCIVGVAPASAKPSSPVLGVKRLMGQYGKGWGNAHPKTIFNGGSPGGLAKRITWLGWGSSVANGIGQIAAYKPGGNYYRELVPIQLEASRLRSCAGSAGKRAYTRLIARARKRPHGPYGDWFPWTLDLCDMTAEPTQCGSMSFTSSSEDGAEEITAFDTSCTMARSVARDSRAVRIKPGDAKYRLRSHSFVCRGYSFDYDALPPTISWTCSRNTAVVTFSRM